MPDKKGAVKIPEKLYVVIGPCGVAKVRHTKKQANSALRQAKWEAGLSKSSNAYRLAVYALCVEES